MTRDDPERTRKMEITEVKVFPIQEEKLKAFVSIVFDHCFMINDIKIIQGRDGLFISMPSRKKKNGEFKDVAHPLNNETRRMIEDQVLAEYDRVLEERGEPPADRGERAVRTPPAAEVEERSLAAAAPERSLEEVEEIHLRDSFWSV
jgi:stage V sporulation protein G